MIKAVTGDPDLAVCFLAKVDNAALIPRGNRHTNKGITVIDIRSGWLPSSIFMRVAESGNAVTSLLTSAGGIVKMRIRNFLLHV